ncbi:hypothetical protein GQ53DRAFT_867242 [Thozetella sp. PMI_491]|nr:hypothetical protein GQ53DRAFT_867242 [Thozetella sp. PMI_491]
MKVTTATSAAEPGRCQTCADFDLPCTNTRPTKRGRPSAQGRMVPVPAPAAQDEPHPASRPLSVDATPDPSTRTLSPAWRAFAQASAPLVNQLMVLHYETAYPIFPLFDRTDADQRLAGMEQARSSSFFCSIMAACALASARVRDGALISANQRRRTLLSIPSETFYAAARHVLPQDLLQAQEFDFLRGCALLAIASIQDGKINAMHKYIGIYFTIMATNQWHARGELADGCPHFQEAHARVEYPTGFEGGGPSPGTQHHPHWILGWNFTTDPYRILKHTVVKPRSRRSECNFMEDESKSLSLHSEGILHRVNAKYSMLPQQLIEHREATGDTETDIYGFQAANIQATLALLQIVLFCLDGNSDLNKKCTVASNVLSTFRQVPTPFLRAISTPLIHHLAGIGSILGSVMEGPLSENSYQRVRDLLLSIASLLGSLEAFLHRSAGADRQLRAVVERINDGAQDPGEELSPQVQLPNELLQEWTWPYDISQAYLPFAAGDLH